MPTLNQNVLINGKVIRKGKSISAANVKKLELGDHLFDQESKAKGSEETAAPAKDSEEKQED